VARDTKTRGWQRHLDGWQAGLVLLVIAASAVVLMVPRAATPEHTPKPAVDHKAIAAAIAGDDAMAKAATQTQLDVDVRDVGRSMRAYNRVVADGDRGALTQARVEMIRAVKKAVGVDEDGLVKLRAYQLGRFLEELGTWQKTGTVSEGLIELSGDFVQSLAIHRWCRADRSLVMDDPTLRALYKKRWTDLAGLKGPKFDLTLDEDRLRYGFLLEHPFVSTATRTGGKLEAGSPIDRVRRGEARLKVLERLRMRDPSYPYELARGVVLYRMNRYTVAADAFRQHLDRFPDGPHTLRVRNYLKASLDRSIPSGP
jgi:hypothetical protein